MKRFYRIADDNSPSWKLVPTKSGWINGYQFGDRVLEGVMFEITVDDKGKLAAAVGPRSKSYFETLNTKKWLKAAVKHAADNDVFLSTEDGSDDDVVLYDTSKPYNEQNSYFEAEPTLEE